MKKDLWDLLEEEIENGLLEDEEASETKEEEKKEEEEKDETPSEEAKEEAKAEVKEALVDSIRGLLSELHEMGVPITESEVQESLYEQLETIVELAKIQGVLEFDLAAAAAKAKKAFMSGDIEKGIKKFGRKADEYAKVYTHVGKTYKHGSKGVASAVGDARKLVKSGKAKAYIDSKLGGAKKAWGKANKAAEKFVGD